jgi:hypothetical protein
VLDRGLLEPVPVGQVPGQPVDVADDRHVDLVPLDRPDEVHEVIAADLLERRVVIVLEPRRHLPGRVPLSVRQLGRYRLRRVVGLTETRVNRRPQRRFCVTLKCDVHITDSKCKT